MHKNFVLFNFGSATTMDASTKPVQPRMAELLARFFEQHHIRFWDLGIEWNDPKVTDLARDVFRRGFETFVQSENLPMTNLQPLSPMQFIRFQQFMGHDPTLIAIVERLGGAPPLTAALPAEAFSHMMRPGGNPYLAAEALERMTPWHSQLPPERRANLQSDIRQAINAALTPGEAKPDMATLMTQLAASEESRREQAELRRRYETVARQKQMTNHHPSEWFPTDFNEHDLHRLRHLSGDRFLAPPSAEPSTTQFSREYVREHRLAAEDTRRLHQNLMSARSGNETLELYAQRMMNQMQATIAEQQAEINAMRRIRVDQRLTSGPGDYLWQRDGALEPEHERPSLNAEMRERLESVSPSMSYEKAQALMNQMQAMREQKPRDVAHRTFISNGTPTSALESE